jgi:hypothetical protein
LIATWSGVDELFGAERVYCHTFFGLADGSALAFFQFANKEDQDLFDPALVPSPFRHIALKVDATAQADLEQRLEAAKWEGSFVWSTATVDRCTQLIPMACWSSSPSMHQQPIQSMLRAASTRMTR